MDRTNTSALENLKSALAGATQLGDEIHVQGSPEEFILALCKALDAWQSEYNDLQDREQELSRLMQPIYDLLDALGISPSANPGTNRMSFYKGKKIIYGYRPTKKQLKAWRDRSSASPPPE